MFDETRLKIVRNEENNRLIKKNETKQRMEYIKSKIKRIIVDFAMEESRAKGTHP